MDLQRGAVIAGRYRVEARVGAGGMGEVFSAEHLAVGVKVALKRLLVAAAENHEVVARFKREAVFLGKIRSDHVARVLDFVTDEKYGLILVMEFVEGDPLSKILGARTLSVEETIDLGADISAALVDLHRHHIVHRDLKPGNIIWQTLANGQHRAIIVDFGVSRILSQGEDADEEMTGITRADMALGTIEYMAPEQILNSRDVTAASDIYALGAILYRAHAGKHVFGDVYDAELAKKKIWTDPTPLETGRSDKLSRGLEAVVNRALVRSPKKRYAHADEVLAELNMLRDLVKAASFDIDTMTTRDNSAILEALAAAEAKKSKEESVTAQPMPASAAAPASAPASTSMPSSVSATVQSSDSYRASTTPVPPEPRIITKGVSPAIAILGFVAALVSGTFLGTRLGPTAGGLLPADRPGQAEVVAPPPSATAAATASAAAAASVVVAPSGDSSALPAASGGAVAEPSLSAEPDASAAGTKPKLHGKLPEGSVAGVSTKTASTATTTAPATAAPTSAPAATSAATTAPTAAPKPSTTSPVKPPSTTAPVVKDQLF
jgi:serine/threonine protein kinase